MTLDDFFTKPATARVSGSVKENVLRPEEVATVSSSTTVTIVLLCGIDRNNNYES